MPSSPRTVIVCHQLSVVRASISDSFDAEFPATREHFDKAGFVRFNAEYPGRWRAYVLDLLTADERAPADRRPA